MRQDSSVTSSVSTSAQALHPVLQAALDGLDVELEEELARYRRQRHRQARGIGQSQSPVQPFVPKQTQASDNQIQLPLETRSSSMKQADQVDLSLEPVASTQLDRDKSATDEPAQSLRSKRIENAQIWMDNPSPSALTAPWAIGHGDALESPESPESLESPKSLESPSVQAHSHPNLSEASHSNPATSASALTAVATNLVSEPSAPSEFSDAPEDYLESSEELLRGIAEAEAVDRRVERESSLLDSLLTPLGIGSMLLLLLSSATLGYVIMHPSSLGGLTARKPDNSSTATAGERVAPSASPLPDSPNLAAEEFVDLNLNSLSTLPGATAPPEVLPPSPTATVPNPTAVSPGDPGSIATAPMSEPPPMSNPASEPVPASSASAPIVPPDPQPVYVQPSAPVSVAPLPPVAPVPAADANPSPRGNYYYVVTPYNGDPSLESAREAVPDAYVRNFEAGASVQLGAFSEADRAEELIQQLQEQGIPAEVYQAQPVPGGQ